jgi:argininosuccinate lyase
MRSRSVRGSAQRANEGFLEFTSSVHFDGRLWRQDIAGSIAHARTLAQAGIFGPDELSQVEDGLRTIASDMRKGALTLDPDLEDIHMNIEKILTDRVGDAGARLHTGRSRNDQVALDTRLYVREALVDTASAVTILQEGLLSKAHELGDAIMPGYTHMQHGQPVLASHHMLSYFWKLQRDLDRMFECYQRVNVSPLGSGALAGAAFGLDRGIAADTLRMRKVSENSLDAVSDRDFVAESLFDLSMLMIHLSSLCEEIITWSSQEFGFVRLPEDYSGGSSMMPQKRNPDIAELIRGRSAVAIGNLVTILALLKSLPLAYNRDLQEDKETLFDVFDTAEASLHALTHFLAGLKFDRARMRESAEAGLMTATDLADFLTTRGVPFRTAHGIVRDISSMSADDERAFIENAKEVLSKEAPHIGDVDLGFLTLENAVKNRCVEGGTSPDAVMQQTGKAKHALERSREKVSALRLETNTVETIISG